MLTEAYEQQDEQGEIISTDGECQARAFQSFCLGAAKTGTTSVAKAFSGHYRAAHEPDLPRTFNLIKKIRYHKVEDMPSLLLQRDQELNLEMEASHPSIFLTPFLLEVFPQAKFVITVRNPRSWLSSRLDFHYKKRADEYKTTMANLKRQALYNLRPVKNALLELLMLREVGQGSWRDYNDMLAKTSHGPYGDEDKFLRSMGISSIETYLREYSNHYRLALSIPKHRRMVVNLNELDSRLDDIARFVGADPAKVMASSENVNTGKTRPKLIERIAPRFVSNKLDLHCGWMVAEGLVDRDWE